MNKESEGLLRALGQMGCDGGKFSSVRGKVISAPRGGHEGDSSVFPQDPKIDEDDPRTWPR